MSKKIPISTIPELMEIWDWEKNEISPYDIGKRSDIKVWWICPKGHDSYQQTPRHKTSRSAGCPKCNIENRVKQRTEALIKEKGSILITHPEIAADWDYEKNDKSPENILYGSHKKCWWKCPACNHSYFMSPNMRTSKTRGCPICGNKAKGISKRKNLIEKYGTLEETHPLIAREWDYKKNTDTPNSVHYGMAENRWWICPKGHPSYMQPIRDRVRRNYGCPKCNGEAQTSFPEQALFYYIKQVYPSAKNRYVIDKIEIDIYIDTLSVGIEYDGSYWHRNKLEMEKRKDLELKQKGIKVIRIKERDSKHQQEPRENIIFVDADSEYLYINSLLKTLLKMLGDFEVDVDIKRDAHKIWTEYLSDKKNESLESEFPDLITEWDFSRNLISPSQVTPHSNKIVFWICKECGNKYEMRIGDRTKKNASGCPICGKAKLAEIQRSTKLSNIKKISSYRQEHPEATKTECAKALNLSYPTIRKYWVCYEGED